MEEEKELVLFFEIYDPIQEGWIALAALSPEQVWRLPADLYLPEGTLVRMRAIMRW